MDDLMLKFSQMLTYGGVFMKDEKTLAYINLFAILGSIPKLCRECREAAEIIKNDKISIGFSVKDGPCGTLVFNRGECYMVHELKKCDIRLHFSSCKKFNGMIDGTVTPIPRKGLLRVGFLLKKFMPLNFIMMKKQWVFIIIWKCSI